MRFLFPAFLAALPVLLVPLLLHLFDRWRARPLELPTVRFLLQRADAGRAARRLRQPLLLLIRALCLCLLVIVFAHPDCGTDSELPVGERVLLVVDNSPSMARLKDGRRLLDQALSEADSLARLLAARGCEVLRTALDGDDPARIGNTVEPSAALAAALEKRPGVAAVFLFSDFKRSLWGDTALADVALFCRPIGFPTTDNAFPESLGEGDTLFIEGEAAEVGAVLASSGERVPVRWRLLVNGRALAEGRSEAVPAGTRVRIPFVVPRAGLLALRLELDGDAFGADNARMAVKKAHAVLRVRRIGRLADSRYLDAGLAAALGERVVYVSEDPHLIVLAGDGLGAAGLQAARQAGVPMLLFLPAAADPLAIRSLLDGLPVGLPVEGGNYRHELLRLVPGAGMPPLAVSTEVTAAWRLRPAPDAGALRVLAEARDGSPLAWLMPGGPLALFSFQPLPAETGLVHMPEFPVFLRRLIGHMVHDQPETGILPDPLPAGFRREADRLIAVNPDPRESRLGKVADEEALARLAPQAQILSGRIFSENRNDASPLPDGSLLLWAAVAALLALKTCELLLVGRDPT